MQQLAYKKVCDGAFMNALQNLKSKPIKVTTSVKLIPFLKSIKEKSTEFEEIRLNLCKNLAKKGENGEPIMIKEGNSERFAFGAEEQAQFDKEFKELLEQKIELPPPSLALDEIKHLEITAGDLELLWEVVIKPE